MTRGCRTNGCLTPRRGRSGQHQVSPHSSGGLQLTAYGPALFGVFHLMFSGPRLITGDQRRGARRHRHGAAARVPYVLQCRALVLPPLKLQHRLIQQRKRRRGKGKTISDFTGRTSKGGERPSTSNGESCSHAGGDTVHGKWSEMRRRRKSRETRWQKNK